VARGARSATLIAQLRAEVESMHKQDNSRTSLVRVCRPRGLTSAALATVAILGAHCGQRESLPTQAQSTAVQSAPGTASAPPPAPAPPAPPTPEPPAPPVDVSPFIRAVRDRQQCNNVSGCKAADELVALGEAAVAPVQEALAHSPLHEPAALVFVEVLGRIGSRALPAQKELLRVARQKVGFVGPTAIVALGRIGSTEARSEIEALRTAAIAEGALGTQVAAAYALFRLGDKAARAQVAAALQPGDIQQSNPGLALLVIPLFAELELREALPVIRAAARHESFFARREAARALGRLRDTESVDLLLGMVGAEPSVHEAAAKALQRITGESHWSADAWKAWAAKR
jgi:hypothetical protein